MLLRPQESHGMQAATAYARTARAAPRGVEGTHCMDREAEQGCVCRSWRGLWWPPCPVLPCPALHGVQSPESLALRGAGRHAVLVSVTCSSKVCLWGGCMALSGGCWTSMGPAFVCSRAATGNNSRSPSLCTQHWGCDTLINSFSVWQRSRLCLPCCLPMHACAMQAALSALSPTGSASQALAACPADAAA